MVGGRQRAPARRIIPSARAIGASGRAIVQRGITMCPQGWRVFAKVSVHENLEMGARTRPRLCIFDEPSLGLAPKIGAEVGETIARIKSTGMTILLVEQNAAMAVRLPDRACVFEAGPDTYTGHSIRHYHLRIRC